MTSLTNDTVKNQMIYSTDTCLNIYIVIGNLCHQLVQLKINQGMLITFTFLSILECKVLQVVAQKIISASISFRSKIKAFIQVNKELKLFYTTLGIASGM